MCLWLHEDCGKKCVMMGRRDFVLHVFNCSHNHFHTLMRTLSVLCDHGCSCEILFGHFEKDFLRKLCTVV